MRPQQLQLGTSPAAAAVLQANKIPFAKRASQVPGTADDSVFPHTAGLAELEEKNDHVKCPYLHQRVTIWSLSENPPKDHCLQSEPGAQLLFKEQSGWRMRIG